MLYTNFNNTFGFNYYHEGNDQNFVRTTSLSETNRLTYRFIAKCDLSDKDSYLEWVKEWKKITKTLEKHNRFLKSLRRPADAIKEPAFATMFDAWCLTKADKDMYVTWDTERKLSYFESNRAESLKLLKEVLNDLYRARRNMKLASRMKVALLKTNER